MNLEFLLLEFFPSIRNPNLLSRLAAFGGIQKQQFPGSQSDINGGNHLEISKYLMTDIAQQMTERVAEILKKN